MLPLHLTILPPSPLGEKVSLGVLSSLRMMEYNVVELCNHLSNFMDMDPG